MAHQSQVAPGLVLTEDLDRKQLLASPMCINGQLLLQYAADAGGIKLTRTGAFNRRCVTWAADEFGWPGHERNTLYRFNHVLNEDDFLPLAVMHDLLVADKLLRHQKGRAVLSKTGKEILGNCGRLQVTLFETYFTAFDFAAYERLAFAIEARDYPHWFAVIDNRSDEWVLLGDLAQWCLPVPTITRYRISALSDASHYLWSRLIQPLWWLGLLDVVKGPLLARIETRQLRKTSLFNQLLRFPDPNQSVSSSMKLH